MEGMPPGFRFYPTEDELVSFYLHNKLEEHGLNHVIDRVIPVLDIYEFNPWDLPQHSGEFCDKDPEQWFFFIPRQESEARGGRPKRLTTTGYWKATGSPGYVYSNNRIIGLKRTMVFYKGRAPSGKKTEWKMNEYKAIEGEATPSNIGAIPTLKQEFSLCRVYNSSKCLRAFDRRPLGPVVDEPPAQQAVADHPIDDTNDVITTTTTTFVDHPIGRTSSSPESSSSGDQSGQFPSKIAHCLDMEIENEPLWNWEQTNWFCGM